MKYAHLERVRIDLRVLAPTFIGSARQETLTQKEMVYLPEKKRVLIPNMGLLLAQLAEKDLLDDFEQKFCSVSSSAAGAAMSLADYLRSRNVAVSEHEPWVQNVLEIGSATNRINQLNRMIKTADGRPYIPGSSIKGMLRTALLAQLIKEPRAQSILNTAEMNPKARCDTSTDRPMRWLKYDTERRDDAVKDLMRAVQISDSAPFERDALIVCQKLELQQDGTMPQARMPLYRECLRPGSKTHFYLTLDRTMTGNLITVEKIVMALKARYARQKAYMDQFDQTVIALSPMTRAADEIPVVLGGGVGFQSKSLIYRAAAIARTDAKPVVHGVLRAQFGRTYKPQNNNAPAPYRLKIAQVHGVYYPMGWCALKINAE